MTTVKEYAQENNVTTRTVYRWIDEGKIQAEKVDGKLVIIGDISTTPTLKKKINLWNSCETKTNIYATNFRKLINL